MQLHEEAGAVRRETLLPVPREEAWAAVCDDDWLGLEREERRAVDEEVVEGRRLSFTWDGDDGGRTLVDITLDDAEDGTRVTVVELPLVTLRAVGASVAARAADGPRMLACA
ncbi:MAG: SRPBCC domain-containing protein [Solirubrobacterales bacterium]|nr:SRPBCC domain-containing protein [Solirubrobacterales bacterium]